jgi:hypothetical protein
LSLNRRVLESFPLEVFLLKLRIGGGLGLLGDRLDGLGAIDGLLRARNIRQTGSTSSLDIMHQNAQIVRKELIRLLKPVHDCELMWCF